MEGVFPPIWVENPQLGWPHSPGSYFSLRSQKTHRIQVTVSSQRLLHKEKIWCLSASSWIYKFYEAMIPGKKAPIRILSDRLLHYDLKCIQLWSSSPTKLVFHLIKLFLIEIRLYLILKNHESRKGVLHQTWHDQLLGCHNLVQFPLSRIPHSSKQFLSSRCYHHLMS